MLRNVWIVCRQLTEILLDKQPKTIQNKTQLTKKNTKKNKRNKKEYENCTYVEKGGEHAAENRKKRTYAFNRCRQMARIFVVALRRRRRRRRRHCCCLSAFVVSALLGLHTIPIPCLPHTIRTHAHTHTQIHDSARRQFAVLGACMIWKNDVWKEED